MYQSPSTSGQLSPVSIASSSNPITTDSLEHSVLLSSWPRTSGPSAHTRFVHISPYQQHFFYAWPSRKFPCFFSSVHPPNFSPPNPNSSSDLQAQTPVADSETTPVAPLPQKFPPDIPSASNLSSTILPAYNDSLSLMPTRTSDNDNLHRSTRIRHPPGKLKDYDCNRVRSDTFSLVHSYIFLSSSSFWYVLLSYLILCFKSRIFCWLQTFFSCCECNRGIFSFF